MSTNSEWRATLRAQDIPRRPPHTQRPAEKTTSVFPPRRVVIPLAALEEAQLESIAEELGLPMDPAPSSYTPPPTTLAPAPETQPSKEGSEMAAPKAEKKGPKNYRPLHVIDTIVAEVLAMGPRIPGVRDGSISAVAHKHGISNGQISHWVKKHGKRVAKATQQGGGASQPTLVSSPQSAPMSAAVSVRGPLPPVPAVTLQGLEEYINAIVDRRIKERLAAMLGGG